MCLAPAGFMQKHRARIPPFACIMRFKVGDKVQLFAQYVPLYGRSGTVVAVRPDNLRAMFDEYVIECPNSRHRVFAFQLLEDVSSRRTVQAEVAFDDQQRTPQRSEEHTSE